MLHEDSLQPSELIKEEEDPASLMTVCEGSLFPMEILTF